MSSSFHVEHTKVWCQPACCRVHWCVAFVLSSIVWSVVVRSHSWSTSCSDYILLSIIFIISVSSCRVEGIAGHKLWTSKTEYSNNYNPIIIIMCKGVWVWYGNRPWLIIRLVLEGLHENITIDCCAWHFRPSINPLILYSTPTSSPARSI